MIHFREIRASFLNICLINTILIFYSNLSDNILLTLLTLELEDFSMCVSFFGFLLLFVQLFHAASFHKKHTSYQLFYENSMERRLRRSLSHDSISSISGGRKDRTLSISSTNTSLTVNTLNSSNLPEILNRFLVENSPPTFLERHRPFNLTKQDCWLEYFLISKIPLHSTFTVIEQLLAIEKERPHVPYERAVMAIRFNEYFIGTQFHPEADPEGMSMYLQRDDKKKTVIENHGEPKWKSMIDQLNDPDKINWTYSHILPNFLNIAVGELVAE